MGARKNEAAVAQKETRAATTNVLKRFTLEIFTGLRKNIMQHLLDRFGGQIRISVFTIPDRDHGTVRHGGCIKILEISGHVEDTPCPDGAKAEIISYAAVCLRCAFSEGYAPNDGPGQREASQERHLKDHLSDDLGHTHRTRISSLILFSRCTPIHYYPNQPRNTGTEKSTVKKQGIASPAFAYHNSNIAFILLSRPVPSHSKA